MHQMLNKSSQKSQLQCMSKTGFKNKNEDLFKTQYKGEINKSLLYTRSQFERYEGSSKSPQDRQPPSSLTAMNLLKSNEKFHKKGLTQANFQTQYRDFQRKKANMSELKDRKSNNSEFVRNLIQSNKLNHRKVTSMGQQSSSFEMNKISPFESQVVCLPIEK